MTRATETLTTTVITATAYLVVFFGLVPLPETIHEKIVPVLPWWILMSFGCYCLNNIGYALYSFRDCPEAHQELMNEIQQAKADLSAKGI